MPEDATHEAQILLTGNQQHLEHLEAVRLLLAVPASRGPVMSEPQRYEYKVLTRDHGTGYNDWSEDQEFLEPQDESTILASLGSPGWELVSDAQISPLMPTTAVSGIPPPTTSSAPCSQYSASPGNRHRHGSGRTSAAPPAPSRSSGLGDILLCADLRLQYKPHAIDGVLVGILRELPAQRRDEFVVANGTDHCGMARIFGVGLVLVGEFSQPAETWRSQSPPGCADASADAPAPRAPAHCRTCSASSSASPTSSGSTATGPDLSAVISASMNARSRSSMWS